MSEEVDRVGEIFQDQTVLISGASGFLGKVLVEKLLRCTEVKKLYLLIRPKKGKSPQDRLKEMFDTVLFSKLKSERPASLKKCEIIPGNVLEENLGITTAHREQLQDEVNFIFHSAATTRFDDTLKYAVQMNTRGTKFMLDLAKKCNKLKLFIHVSTAYAFPKEKVLYEKMYDPPVDPNQVLENIDWSQNKIEPEFEQKLLGDSPNTYTFSKALAEGLVNQAASDLPIIIARPAVVIPTWKEPFSGFFNNLQSPMGIFVGAGKGVIRTMYMDSKSYANLIPADSTINAMLVAAWDYLSTKKNKVFNICIPQEDIKLNWEEIIEMGKEAVHTKVPFNGILWYPEGTMTKSKAWHYLNFILFQIIPAVFIDLLFFCLGYKPILLSINQRIHKSQEMFEYYTTKAWDFNVEYLLSMRRKLNNTEKERYKIEAEDVNIKEYLCNCILYARRHILKEGDDRLPTAKRNMKLFFVLDRIVKIGFFYIVFRFIYNLLF